jgi:hypothetical protein
MTTFGIWASDIIASVVVHIVIVDVQRFVLSEVLSLSNVMMHIYSNCACYGQLMYRFAFMYSLVHDDTKRKARIECCISKPIVMVEGQSESIFVWDRFRVWHSRAAYMHVTC